MPINYQHDSRRAHQLACYLETVGIDNTRRMPTTSHLSCKTDPSNDKKGHATTTLQNSPREGTRYAQNVPCKPEASSCTSLLRSCNSENRQAQHTQKNNPRKEHAGHTNHSGKHHTSQNLTWAATRATNLISNWLRTQRSTNK